MNLREEILKEHSKAQCAKIVCWVADSQQRFNELLGLFLNDEYRVVQRAAWPVSYCVEAHPKLMKNNFGKLIKNLQKANLHDAVKRNSVRLLQHVDIPEQYHGEVMNICFSYVESPKEAVAIKAFALTVLGNLAKQYPDIIPEIKLLIEDQLPNQTAAFKSRAKQLMKTLKL
ncbi:MAG: hypothetical protein IPP72_09180 [Chitinophagaceae bacterium]|nr:hypothetical protein [Chitinophagaceae bacterium]